MSPTLTLAVIEELFPGIDGARSWRLGQRGKLTAEISQARAALLKLMRTAPHAAKPLIAKYNAALESRPTPCARRRHDPLLGRMALEESHLDMLSTHDLEALRIAE